MCVARLCTDVYALDTVQWRTDTQQGYRQRAENKQTNLGSYSIPTELMSLSHDVSHAITPYLGNKVICD